MSDPQIAWFKSLALALRQHAASAPVEGDDAGARLVRVFAGMCEGGAQVIEEGLAIPEPGPTNPEPPPKDPEPDQPA